MVVQKTPQEIELMARAGEILAAVHERLSQGPEPSAGERRNTRR
jgi:Xaa-Pro aminopeptidase